MTPPPHFGHAPAVLTFMQAWKTMGRGDVLHRVSRIDDLSRLGDEYEPGVMIHGMSCCGRWGAFDMPGVFSRLGAPRCRTCCRSVDLDYGHGIPGNGGDAGPMDDWQTVA